jgi:hypothetical protein
MRNCKRLDIKKGVCCRHCWLPQTAFGEKIHGNIETGECEEGLKDLLKGMCWKIFRDDHLNGKYLEEELIVFEDDKEFKRWIIQRDMSGEMINGCRLMLEVWKDRR